jgi:hypothetical protein
MVYKSVITNMVMMLMFEFISDMYSKGICVMLSKLKQKKYIILRHIYD